MRISFNLRNRKFRKTTEVLDLNPDDVQRMIETGWIATVEGVGRSAEIVLSQGEIIRIPVADGRAGAEWASEFNRRSEEIHTPQ